MITFPLCVIQIPKENKEKIECLEGKEGNLINQPAMFKLWFICQKPCSSMS